MVKTYEHGVVRVDPKVSFGRPAVRGVRTEVIAGRFLAGESIASIVHDYQFGRWDTEAALRFELRKAKRRKPVTP